MSESAQREVVDHIRGVWAQVDAEYDGYFSVKAEPPDCVQCHKAHCCRQLVLCTEEEASIVRDTVRQWPQRKRQELARRLAALPNQARESFAGDCPFLVDERCQVYAVRPVACRSFHSLNKSKCKRRRKALDPVLWRHLSTMNQALRAWLEARGARARVVAMAIWMKFHLDD